MAGGLKSAAARSHLRANAGVLEPTELPKLLSSYQWYLSAAADTYQVTYKVPFKVRNVTLVTIAWGGTHRTMAACVFYLGETTLQRVQCAFYRRARSPGAMPPTNSWRWLWHSKATQNPL